VQIDTEETFNVEKKANCKAAITIGIVIAIAIIATIAGISVQVVAIVVVVLAMLYSLSSVSSYHCRRATLPHRRDHHHQCGPTP
jgi:uncharacterized membrane protein YkgB